MTTEFTRDKLFFGWQDNKFVLMIMRDEDKLAHRISLTDVEASCVFEEYKRPTFRTKMIPNHKQVDSDVLPQEFTRAKRYKPRTSVVLRQLEVCYRSFGEGILVGELVGEQCFSNGHVILIGEPPEAKRAPKAPKFSEFLKYAQGAEPLKFVCAQHVSKGEWEAQGATEASTTEVIWFNKGNCIDALYYDFVLERYPDAVFAVQAGDDEKIPLVIYSSSDADDVKGKLVGFLMAMRYPANGFVEQLRAELDSEPRTT